MEPYKIVILKIARQDIKEAKDWYNQQKKGLGKRFWESLTSSFAAIERNPTSFAVRYKDYRVANCRIFPYAVHFFIDNDSNCVFITAILHTSRNPKVWTDR